jgi:hypothetical protein
VKAGYENSTARMSEIENPYAPDINIGLSLIIFEWALAGVAAAILGARWYTVTAIQRRVRLADYLMLIAFVCHFPLID